MDIEILPEEKYINLSDLSLIAALRYFGVRENAVDRNNPSKICFVFEKTGSVNELIRKFYAQELAVEPQVYFLHLKSVKNRIYSQEE